MVPYCFDDSVILPDLYNHIPIDNGNAHEKEYFHISAPNFTQDLGIGFSNGYTDHTDSKFEIIAGGWNGEEFVIRPGNDGATIQARLGRFPDNSVWLRMRSNLAVQVTDGNIALYSANPDGSKKDLLVEWNDSSIVKADLNTLTMTGGHGGQGDVRIRGVCEFCPNTISDSNVITDDGTVGPVWLGIKDVSLGNGSNTWQNYYDGSTPSYFNWAGGESNQCCQYVPFIDMPAEQGKG